MRQGIFREEGGVRIFDIQKILGKCFGNAWFTNTKGIRYRALKGARNCKKSYNMIGYESVMKIISDPMKNILFIRQQDVDNRDSTFAQVNKAIADLGLEAYFKTTSQPLRITYLPTGQCMIFRGMSNPTSLNSLTFSTGYLTDVYIEEAYEVESWDAFVKLDQSVRAGMGYDKDGNLIELDIPQQITFLFNAWSDQTWLYTEFFKGRLEDDPEYLETHKYQDYLDPDFIGPGGKGLYLATITFKANEFRNRHQVDPAAAEMKKKNPAYYRTLFLGCWGSATAMTYQEFTKANVVGADYIRDETFAEFAIGIDTGLSQGDGKHVKVGKNDDVSVRVKAATVATLVGITQGFRRIVAIEEYYHSNDPTYAGYNTDTRDALNIEEQAAAVLRAILSWRDKYQASRQGKRGDFLMKGEINAYIDSADIGFRQILELMARRMGIYNINFIPSTKTPIQGRVDLERFMFAQGDMLINESCPNLRREFSASRRGKKGEARENVDDHAINSCEYGFSPYRNDIVAWKSYFKEH